MMNEAQQTIQTRLRDSVPYMSPGKKLTHRSKENNCVLMLQTRYINDKYRVRWVCSSCADAYPEFVTNKCKVNLHLHYRKIANELCENSPSEYKIHHMIWVENSARNLWCKCIRRIPDAENCMLPQCVGFVTGTIMDAQLDMRIIKLRATSAVCLFKLLNCLTALK